MKLRSSAGSSPGRSAPNVGVKAGIRNAEVEGRRTEDGGRRTEDRRRKTRGQRTGNVGPSVVRPPSPCHRRDAPLRLYNRFEETQGPRRPLTREIQTMSDTAPIERTG